MHKIILYFFKNLNNIGQTLSLICSFLIMTNILYWLENIINATWNWLNFIKPVLNIILDFSNEIFPFSFNAFGTVFDGKFITATFVLIITMVILRVIIKWIKELEYYYEKLHIVHKKTIEKSFNQSMSNQVYEEEKKILNYMVLINTKLKKKFSHKELNINISEYNESMNNLLLRKTGVSYEPLNDGYLYRFDNFNKIDDVLDVLFKIKNSPSTPLDYSICIQAGNNLTQLIRLADLQYFDKILFCADTLLRYKCNKSHRYGTDNVGIFQKEYGTIEVYEFEKI